MIPQDMKDLRTGWATPAAVARLVVESLVSVVIVLALWFIVAGLFS
jgi:hypothetical protein